MRQFSWRLTLLALPLALTSPIGLTAQQATPAPARGITNITGQLYRAQNDNHYNVFLVTPEGVILTDPINREFALWLKQEIAQRFKQPVRYVLYSHHDWDHASGGAVFADTGLPLLFQALLQLPTDPRRLRIVIAGGAAMLCAPQDFNLGDSNTRATIEFLARHNLTPFRTEIGGTVNRTLHFEIGTGTLTLKIGGTASVFSLAS